MIQNLKSTAGISGRTIQVADKGLNCGNNIYAAIRAGDGYIFSKGVKGLPQEEKTWLLLGRGWRKVEDADGHLLYRVKTCRDDFTYAVDDGQGGKRLITLPEKRVAIFNPKLAEKKRLEIARQVARAKGLTAPQAKRNAYGDCAKYITFQPAARTGKTLKGKVTTKLNEDKISEDLQLVGYNLLVTSERRMSAREIYETYHGLWRIEESFKVMKSYLDARPVYLQKRETITGHFLICYLAVLLLRLLQFDVFDNKLSTEALIWFMRTLTVVPEKKGSWINITAASDVISFMSEFFDAPIQKYYIRGSALEKLFMGKI